MLTIIAIVIVVLIASVLVFAATKPDTFRIRRAASIKAPPEKVFPLINDFRNWGAWSPWEKKDPAMKRQLGATASGKGAVYEWEGNKDVGQGRMEIAESVPLPGSRSPWISSSPSQPTTLSSSRWSPQATPRTSRGPCKAARPTLPRSSTCFHKRETPYGSMKCCSAIHA